MRRFVFVLAILFVAIFLIGNVKAEDCYFWHDNLEYNAPVRCYSSSQDYNVSINGINFVKITNCKCDSAGQTDTFNYTQCSYNKEITTGSPGTDKYFITTNIDNNNVGDSSKCDVCQPGEDDNIRSLVFGNGGIDAKCRPPYILYDNGETQTDIEVRTLGECAKNEWFTILNGQLAGNTPEWRTVQPCSVRSSICSFIKETSQTQSETPGDLGPINTTTKVNNWGVPCCADLDGDQHQKQEYKWGPPLLPESYGTNSNSKYICGSFENGDCYDGPEVIRKDENGINNSDDVRAREISKQVWKGCKMQVSNVKINFSGDYLRALKDNGVIDDKFLEREVIGKKEVCDKSNNDSNGDGYSALDQPNCESIPNLNAIQYPLEVEKNGDYVGTLTAVDGSELQCDVDIVAEPLFWNAGFDKQFVRFEIYAEKNPSFLQTVKELYKNPFVKPSTSNPEIQGRFTSGGYASVFEWLAPQPQSVTKPLMPSEGDGGITCEDKGYISGDEGLPENLRHKKFSCSKKFTVPSGWRGKWVMCAAYPFMDNPKQEKSIYFRQKAQFSDPIGVAERVSVWIPRNVTGKLPAFSLQLVDPSFPNVLYNPFGAAATVNWDAPEIDANVFAQVSFYNQVSDTLSAIQWYDKQIFMNSTFTSKQHALETDIKPVLAFASNSFDPNIYYIDRIVYDPNDGPSFEPTNPDGSIAMNLMDLSDWISFDSSKDRQVSWTNMDVLKPNDLFNPNKLKVTNSSVNVNATTIIKVLDSVDVTIMGIHNSFSVAETPIILIDKAYILQATARKSSTFAHEKGHSDASLCDEYNLGRWGLQNATQSGGCPNPFPEYCKNDQTLSYNCPGMPYYPNFNTPDPNANTLPGYATYTANTCVALSIMGDSQLNNPCVSKIYIYPTLTSRSSYCQLRSANWDKCQLESPK